MMKKLNHGELKQALSTYPTITQEHKNAEDPVLKFRKSVHYNYDGLSMRVFEQTELSNVSNVAEIPAALSFNIVLEGIIDIVLGGKNYSLGNQHNSEAECFAYIINRPELFTRYVKKGRIISHINLFVEKSWLEKRYQTDESKKILEDIFQHHNQVHYWKPSKKLLNLATKIFSYEQAKTPQQYMHIESLALKLFSYYFTELEDFITKLATPPKQKNTADTNIELKHQIDQLLINRYSIDDIAKQLGLSPSTLQRRFKKFFGVTVNHYCRQKLLEEARRAIVLEGKSIGEAAYLAGYNHTSNFTSAFKKRFNETPAELVKKIS